MRSNKKGFTLIELLAVIVILAIIALIATPIVLNIITKVKTSAAQDSVYGAIDALTLKYGESQLDPNGGMSFPIKVNFADKSITYGSADTAYAEKLTSKGQLPSEGTLTLNDDGTIAATDLKVNGIGCTVNADKKTVTCS